MQYAAGEIYTTLSPELKLVLLCSSLKNKDNEQKAINDLIAENMDWGLFLHLAFHHKIYPLVYRCLKTLQHPEVPEEVLAALRQETNRNISHTLLMVAELVRVLGIMQQNGIHAMVMKGFPLAYELYGDMTLRPANDLDILVWPEDIDKTREVLGNNGYYLKPSMAKLSSEQLKKWMESNQHLCYWHGNHKIVLELHWRLDCHGMDIPMEQAKNSLRTVEIAGHLIRVLRKEELFLYLVLHGAVHAWFRLKWLYDIDIMIRQAEFSWENLYQLADSLGLTTLLNQALILSWGILKTPIPITTFNLAIKDKEAKDLGVRAIQFITDNEYHLKKRHVMLSLLFQWQKYQLYLQVSWQKRMLFILRCFLPSDEDFEMISLSGKLYFLYYIMSPFTWCGRRLRNMVRGYKIC